MPVRSDLLTYWTGKDIEVEPAKLDQASRALYQDRLFDILECGLWMTSPQERLEARAGGEALALSLQTHLTCFTEMRLSAARTHRLRYGAMGLVVNRKFVLERGGGPVLYVRNHDDDLFVANLVQVIAWMKSLGDDVEQAPDIVDATFFLSSFVKGMSDAGTDNFAYIDEHEWRIVHTYSHGQNGWITATGGQRPKYRIPVSRNDVQMLVVPDSIARDAVLNDKRFDTWSRGSTPPILTIAETEQL